MLASQLGLTDEQVSVGLGAMKAIALANHEFAHSERALLETVAHGLGVEVDIGTLHVATPAQAAAAFPDAKMRERLLQVLIVTALIDESASPEEVALVDQFAAALGVDDPRVKNLHQLLDGHALRLKMDVIRRFPLAHDQLRAIREEEGLRGYWKMFKGLALKMYTDPDLAMRYKRLGLLPHGTLGREFWEHMGARKLPFPGEPGGAPEPTVHHDFTHVLTGYDTDQMGEMEISAFYAGYWKEDPFAILFLAMLTWHLGLKLSTNYQTGRGNFDPERMLAALERGARCKVDFTKHWDHWAVIERPLEELRAAYNL